MSRKVRGRKAWLVTWEWAGDHAKRVDPVAAVFKPQFSGERVRELVEFLHATLEYSLRERMEIALGLRSNPYAAEFGAISGHRWTGEVICGHNPFLRARLVDDLLIDQDNQATWVERPRPTFPTRVEHG
jgi:hypothetical protein